ncbi:MAG: hypothetical protein HOV68_23215 [Streptomycetaceae bacterium]|nr:hypothetical protein [Streptomycetaceae bacterium]
MQSLAVPPSSPSPSPSLPAQRSAPDTPSPSRHRRIVRRTAKYLVIAALGYAVLWLFAFLGMLGAHAWASAHTSGGSGRTVAGINHLKQVDAKVWRGSAPGDAGYQQLASMGVRTVVDLRAEKMSAEDIARPTQAGLNLVRMPIRDGQTPTEAQVNEFLRTVQDSPGPVFVHCGAGVGRTGSMTAAYMLRTGEAGNAEAVKATLAVGPPSVEQVYYVMTGSHHDSDQPPLIVKIISRMLDAPRRMKASM